MYPANFTYHAPSSVDDVLTLMNEHGYDAKIMAGGHSLLPTMKLRLSTPAHLIDLKNLKDMKYVRDEGDYVAIGALTTYFEIMDSSLIQSKAAIFAKTIAQVGDMQVRNLGTLGGSIAHADPAGDPPAAILAADATMVIRNTEGERTVEATDFFQGFFETAVGEGDILTEIRVPVHKGGSAYAKFKHPASGYAVVGVAVNLHKDSDKIGAVRVGITGVSDKAYRATEVENALTGQAFSQDLAASAAERATSGIDPLEDNFANADYRRQLAKALAKKAIVDAWEDS